MDTFGALLFTKPDGQHFCYTAFDGAGKVGVRFDAVDQQNRVGLEGVAVTDNGEAFIAFGLFCEFSNWGDLHGGFNFGANVFWGNAVAMEHLCLTLSGRSSMTAHSGHDEGAVPMRFQHADNRSDDAGEIGNATTTHADATEAWVG